MTHRGELFGESPAACPFLALELDRDRRSDKPDYRHRCFAEPTPQPRAIAHQEAYCLSAEFPVCPIFQGWAMRAAAQPVPVPPGYEGRGAGSAGASAVRPQAPPVLQSPLPPDIAPVVPAPGEPWPSEAFTPPEPPGAPRQIGAFDAPPPSPAHTGALPEEGDLATDQPPSQPSAWSSANPPTEGEHEEAPVPGFLARRRERGPQPPHGARDGAPFREKVAREDLVPSWELTDRYGASVKEERGGDDGGRDRFGGLVTAVAVIAILALGVAGVIYLPGFLSGRGQPATPTVPIITTSPTLPSSDTPTLPPEATATPGPTLAPSAAPTTTPEPAATPRLYRVKRGDQLYKIAARFNVSVADILAANPQITDPDHIIVGQVIVIPVPSTTASP